MGVRKSDQFMFKAMISAVLAILMFPEWADADYYNKVVRFECNPANKEVLITLSQPYQDKPLGKHEIFFELLAHRKEGLKCRLSSRNVVIIRALSNPQARRNDNLEVMVNSRQVATISYDQSSSHVISISEGKEGSVRVLSKEDAPESKFILN